MAPSTSPTKSRPSAGFSPIQINWTLLKSEQLAHLYKFGHLFFPSLTSPAILKTLLNLENEMNRVLLNIPAEERMRIQEGLEGITIDIKISVADEGAGDIIAIPVRIQPAAVMKRAILGKGTEVDLEGQLTELKKGLFEFITKEGARMMKKTVEGFFKGKVREEGIKGPIQELVRTGAITRSGRLKTETTIEDLLTGKYSEAFSKAANREVLNAGLLIEQSLMSLYEWGDLDMEEWARDVKKDLELISQSLKEMRS